MALFTVTTKKQYQDYIWTNAYQIACDDIEAAVAAADNLMTFEAAILWNACSVIGAHVAPLPDPSGEGFVNVAGSIAGALSWASGIAEPAELVAFVTLDPVSGRPGKKFYRFCYTENEVIPAGSGMAFVPDGFGIIAAFPAARTALITATIAGGWNLIIHNRTTGTTRGVDTLTLVGPRTCNTHHRWYNRTP